MSSHVFFLVTQQQPRSKQIRSSAASDVYKSQAIDHSMSELTLDNPPKTAKPNSYAQARLLQTATPSLLHALIGTFLIVLSGGLFLLTGIKK